MHEWPTSNTGRSSTKHSGHGLHAPRVALAAALRRLTGQPATHSSVGSSQPHSSGLLQPVPIGDTTPIPSNCSSSHHWEIATEDQRSMHTAPLPPPTALDESSSRLACPAGDSLHIATADPYANTPTLNRDIWPVLPNVIVFASHTDSSHEGPSDAQSASKPVDWTTKLGIGLTPQLASSQLSPTPARFKLSGAHRRPKHSFTSGRRRASTSHRPWRSYHRSSVIMNAYTSLARQEIEQERTARRARVSFSTLGGSSFSASGSPRNSYMRRSRRYRSFQGSGDDGQRYWASNRSKASSHGHTHSSASTDQLRKGPSSNFNPAAQFCLGRPPQVRKKHHKGKIRRKAGTTTSTKDTCSSSTTSRSQNARKPSISSGKEGVKQRYRHAISDEAAEQWHTEQVTSMPEPNDFFEHISPSSNSHSISAGIGSSPQADSFMSSNASDTRIHGSHVSPVLVRSNLFRHNEYFPIPDHSFRPLSLTSEPRAQDSPDANSPGPSNWRELATEAQTAHDRSRKRSRNLKLPFPDSKEGRRPRKPKKDKKPKARADQRPWEYQVAEQLLMKSWGSGQSPSSSSRHQSMYHSVQSHKSSDHNHPSQTLSSTAASSHRQTPSSTQPQSPSSSSGAGTLGSFFSDWSRGHQTLPPPTSQLDSYQESLTESSMNLRSRASFRLQRMMSTSIHRLSDDSRSIEQIELGVASRGKGAFSQFRAPWGSSSLGVGSIPREYLKTPDRSSKGSLDSASRFTHQQFSPRTPNDLTHHDQAGLLLPPTGVPPLTSDHDNDFDLSSLSSTSWYDAADGAIAEEPEIVEQDAESIQPLDLSQFRRRSQPVMAPIQRAVSAAIVYDTSFSGPNDGHPVSWLRKASKLFVTCPNLQPTVTVSLSGEPDPTTPDTKVSFGTTANRTECEKGSPGKLLPQPWISSIYAHPKLAPDSVLEEGYRTNRSMSQSCLPDTVVSLPLPPKEIRTRSLFKPTDDPNFLSHPPSQLKQAWKNKTRKARALSEPIKTRHSSKLPTDRQELPSFYSEGIVEPKRVSDQQASTKTEQGKAKLEVAMGQRSVESTGQQVKHLSSASHGSQCQSGANRDLRGSRHSGQHDENENGVVRCNVDGPGSALDSSSSVEAPDSRSCCTVLDTLALVPLNGWCFVFGFIFFPLWYLGSFYPSFNLDSTIASDNQAPAPKRHSPMLIQPLGVSLDISQPQSPLGAEAANDQLLSAQQHPSHSLQRKRMEIRGAANGPLSGWPTRRHMLDTSSESELTSSELERGAQPDGNGDTSGVVGPARRRRARSVSSSEENRQPDFDKGRENKRGLGGFWSEIAPRCDIETAQANDAPMWAYQRALYTWRLRCRVMAVIFPTITIPATLISVLISTR